MLGYLGRTGVLETLARRLNEERVREAGWLSVRARLWRAKMRRTLRRSHAGSVGSRPSS